MNRNEPGLGFFKAHITEGLVLLFSLSILMDIGAILEMNPEVWGLLAVLLLFAYVHLRRRRQAQLEVMAVRSVGPAERAFLEMNVLISRSVEK